MPERHVNERDLDRFLNDMVAGDTTERGYGLAPGIAVSIRAARALSHSPLPAESLDRLDAAIESEIARLNLEGNEAIALPMVSTAIGSPQAFAPNSHASSSRAVGNDTAWRRVTVNQLATAALLLLTMLGSFYVFGPGGSWRRDASSFLPAVAEPTLIPASPVDESEATFGPLTAEPVWQADGGPDMPFIQPGQPAIDLDGNLWVPDRGYNQFLIFAPDGTFLEAWGTPGSGEGEFDFASAEDEGHAFGGVAFDAAGNFFVVDTGNHRVQKFSPDREFITAWGSEGTGQGQFRRAAGIAVDEAGRVYVSDVGWGKIEVFNSDGAWLATWTGLGTPGGMAIDVSGGAGSDGNTSSAVWVSHAAAGIVKFSAEGDRLATWNTYGTEDGAFLDTWSVAVDAEGRVYVADRETHRIQVFAPDGAFLGSWGKIGDDMGEFQRPRGLAIDAHGDIFVVEGAGQRVQKFRLTAVDS